MDEEHFEGFGESSGMGENPALLVIDFMNGFTNPDTQLGSDLTEEINATTKLIEKARKSKMPIIFTNVAYDHHFGDGAHFIEKVPALKILTEGSEATEIDSRLPMNKDYDILVKKKFASAFFGTNLLSILNSKGIDTLILSGCSTSGCVRATAVDGLQYGYRVAVPKECVGDRSAYAHDASLYDINTKYGDVLTLDEVINYITNLRGDGMDV